MPELIKAQRVVWKDDKRIKKPIISPSEMDEFDQRIGYAMENNLAVKITVWLDGFTDEITRSVHYVDPISQQLRIEVKPGEFQRVKIEAVVGVTVID